jgi:succinate dehydrogenase/fumarate reductase cytochrome b subunit
MECQGSMCIEPLVFHGLKWLILFGSRFAGVHGVSACSVLMVSMILTCIATWYYMVVFHGCAAKRHIVTALGVTVSAS